MYKQIYDMTYDDPMDDEMPDDVMMQNYDTTYALDGSDVDDEDDIEEQSYVVAEPKTLTGALRDELKLLEPDRGTLLFRYMGVDYEGVPMLEINPNKFVFKILPSNKLKTFLINEIQLRRLKSEFYMDDK